MPTAKQKKLQKKRTQARMEAFAESLQNLKTPGEIKAALKLLKEHNRETAKKMYGDMRDRAFTYPDKRGLPVVVKVVHARGSSDSFARSHAERLRQHGGKVEKYVHEIEFSNAGNPQTRIAVIDVATNDIFGIDMSVLEHARLGDYEEE